MTDFSVRTREHCGGCGEVFQVESQFNGRLSMDTNYIHALKDMIYKMRDSLHHCPRCSEVSKISPLRKVSFYGEHGRTWDQN